MSTEMMDRRHLSFFSEEICFPTERHIGLWKPDSVPDHKGTEGMAFMAGSKSVSSSPMEKLHFLGSRPLECLELSQPYIFKDKKTKSSLNPSLVRMENTATKSRTWRTAEDCSSASDLQMQHSTRCLEGGKFGLNGAHYENENALFSSSLSEVFKRTLRLSSNDSFDQYANNLNPKLKDEDPFESLQDVEAQTIGNLLPDDDDLFSGVIDDFDCVARPHVGGDFEDDLFCSGGGMELEVDDSFNCNNVSDSLGGGGVSGQQGGLSSAFTGEHPSRTLFVRNINSSVGDAELKDLFEEYGDIRALYTACKHRGFVMISYFDIRAARNAMKALQNKTLRRRKLDIHFSIPKDNPSEKDINQGTLVVFNLDSSVSNEDLCQIFGAYGEIKEIRETPHKQHHKFIEFYDVRSAEAALRALNRSDIAGKKIKLEPSRPGGARRLMQQLCPELEQDETNGCRHGSPPDISPSDYHETITMGMITANGLDNGVAQGLNSSFQTPVSTFMDTRIHGISPKVVHRLSSPVNVTSIGNHASCLVDHNHSVGQMNFSFQSMPAFSPHSLPDYHEGLINGIPCNSASTMSAMPININPMGVDGVDKRNMHRVASGGLDSHSFEHNGTGLGSLVGNGSCRLHGRQLFTNNSISYQHYAPGPMIWSNSPSYMDSIPPQHQQHMHGLPRAPSPMISPAMPLQHHHVGSAPTIKQSIWDMAHVFSGDSAESTTLHPGSLGSMAFSGSSLLHRLEFASQNIFPHSNGNHVDSSVPSTCIGIPSPQQSFHMFHGRNSMLPMPASFDSPNEHVRSRRNDASGNLSDNKKQYELDIDRILHGEDSRTTLMIKNIPNKYTSKMLLAAIDEHHRGTYDFIYLPIDFKNKCNVGYAFINMINPQHIIPFFQAFNGKKWEKFNSEKVASLAYARIQGKAALIAHFQNSSLMNEDKRCRPILFHSNGPNAGDQEPFPIGNNVRTRPGRSRTINNGEHNQGSPTNSAHGDETANLTDSSS